MLVKVKQGRTTRTWKQTGAERWTDRRGVEHETAVGVFVEHGGGDVLEVSDEGYAAIHDKVDLVAVETGAATASGLAVKVAAASVREVVAMLDAAETAEAAQAIVDAEAAGQGRVGVRRAGEERLDKLSGGGSA